MPRKTSSEKSWLSAEVPKFLAEQFKKAAESEDRSPTQHLRHLIRRETALNENERRGEHPTLAENRSGGDRHATS